MSTAPLPVWAVTPEKITEAVRRIVEATHPLKIIMFGSQARGEAHVDSDLDIVVVEREVPDRFAEVVRLHRVLRGLILPADILVIAEKDFEEWSDTPGSVYRSARREGKVLYEAASDNLNSRKMGEPSGGTLGSLTRRFGLIGLPHL